MDLRCKEVFFAKGISGVEPSMEFSTFKTMQLGMPGEHGEHGAVKLYDGLHGFLQDAGVDGVKVLSQVQGQGGGPAVCRKYISALEASAQKHFGSASEVITCMPMMRYSTISRLPTAESATTSSQMMQRHKHATFVHAPLTACFCLSSSLVIGTCSTASTHLVRCTQQPEQSLAVQSTCRIAPVSMTLSY